MKPYLVLCVILVFFNCEQMTAQEAGRQANEVLQEAYQQAAREKKNVFLMFHASWCGWCHKMDSSMNDKTVKDYFQ